MGLPAHVKAIVGLTSCLFLVAGSRDIFAPGMGLPGIPDDDKLIGAVFGSYPNVGTCGPKEAGCVPGRMLFVSQCWGVMVVTIALVKVTTVFTAHEGTFLRRNLFILLGLANLAFGYFIFINEAFFNSKGASGMGFLAAFGVEGAVLLQDGLMRSRVPKKVKSK